MKKRSILPYILIAVVLTLISIVYQRISGPNYPFKFKIQGISEIYNLKLPKTETTDNLFNLNFEIPDTSVSGVLAFRRYPTNEEYAFVPLQRDGSNLSFSAPSLPSAGKYEYYVIFDLAGKKIPIREEKPMIIRFNDPVPDKILISHVFFMVLASFFSMMVTLLTIRKHPSFKKYGLIAFAALTVGGMILGPIVQKFAFGEYWTGIPNGWDLTDNKTLIVWASYLIAAILNVKKDRPTPYLIASILFILINLIPHSMFGSELDPNSGEIIQG